MSGGITELHHAIAKAEGFELYKTYSEPQAAKFLGVSLSTLSRIRNRTIIGHIRKSERRVEYFGFHLVDYLLAQQQCPTIQKRKDTKSEISGSQNKAVVQHGAAHGTTPKLSRQDDLASAKRILNGPRKL